jgi:uncharacterized protein YbaP (TraB family)
MNLFWWKRKRLRTIWRVEKNGKRSFLIGTAHFCPYSFRKLLTKLIQDSEIVLFEGPLDRESMERVTQYGRQGENTPSVYKAIDPGAAKEINRQLGAQVANRTMPSSYFQLIHPKASDYLRENTRGVRPWMAFLTVWSAILDWKYSMDMEAYCIAQKCGKKIQFLETIEDQLTALDGIPFERIVNYLNHVEKWKMHKDQFLKAFLNGEIEKFVSLTGEFPTRCESIIENRDPIFFRRMTPFFEGGKAVAFVGVGHIPGLIQMFHDGGYHLDRKA